MREKKKASNAFSAKECGVTNVFFLGIWIQFDRAVVFQHKPLLGSASNKIMQCLQRCHSGTDSLYTLRHQPELCHKSAHQCQFFNCHKNYGSVDVIFLCVRAHFGSFPDSFQRGVSTVKILRSDRLPVICHEGFVCSYTVYIRLIHFVNACQQFYWKALACFQKWNF